MDKFIYFSTVPKDVQLLLAEHQSPDHENSFWKWIPMRYLDLVRRAIRPAGPFRIVYRGPRIHKWRASTNKKDAVAFTVYEL